MSQRTKIRKREAGWVIERPGYGFGKTTTSRPFDSHADAIDSLKNLAGSAGQAMERTHSPESDYSMFFAPVIY